MTTIAYRDGVLAADGQMTMHEEIVGVNAQKIYPLADGGAIGVCGRPDVAVPLVEWMQGVARGEQVGPKPEIGDECTTIWIKADGTIWLQPESHFFQLEEEFIAIGSGGSAAMVAMRAGLSAVEAVKIACETDVYSGGNIRSITLEHVVEALAKKPAARRKTPSKA